MWFSELSGNITQFKPCNKIDDAPKKCSLRKLHLKKYNKITHFSPKFFAYNYTEMLHTVLHCFFSFINSYKYINIIYFLIYYKYCSLSISLIRSLEHEKHFFQTTSIIFLFFRLTCPWVGPCSSTVNTVVLLLCKCQTCHIHLVFCSSIVGFCYVRRGLGLQVEQVGRSAMNKKKH